MEGEEEEENIKVDLGLEWVRAIGLLPMMMEGLSARDLTANKF